MSRLKLLTVRELRVFVDLVPVGPDMGGGERHELCGLLEIRTGAQPGDTSVPDKGEVVASTMVPMVDSDLMRLPWFRRGEAYYRIYAPGRVCQAQGDVVELIEVES